MLAVETVCGTAQYTYGAAIAADGVSVRAGAWTGGLVAGLQGWATKELVPDCTDTSTTPKHRAGIAQSV